MKQEKQEGMKDKQKKRLQAYAERFAKITKESEEKVNGTQRI